MNWRNRIIERRRMRVGDLVVNKYNPKRHPTHQRQRMEAVLEKFGIVTELVAYYNDAGELALFDGHLRQKLDPEQEWDIAITSLSQTEIDELVLYYDPLAAMIEQDTAMMTALMADLQEVDGVLGKMLEEMAEDAGVVFRDEAVEVPEAQIDKAAELQEKWGTALGQIWELGDHRLAVGDCTDAAVVAQLMGEDRAVLCHADPPYGMGKEKDGIVNDNLYRQKLDAFQMKWWGVLRPHLEDNASAYIWGNAEDLWRLWFMGGLRDSERFTLRNEVVWDKGDAGAGGVSHQGVQGFRMYPKGSERILFFMLGEQGFNINADNYWEGWEPIRSYLAAQVEKMGWGPQDIKRITGVGMYGHWFTKSQFAFITREHYEKLQEAAKSDAFKQDYDDLKQDFYATRAYFDNTHDNMTDVWQFPRVTGGERHDHPTPKPVTLIERIVKSSTPQGAIVVDPFLGSGTTLVACEQTGRIGYGMEIEPKYCAVSLERMSQMGLEPRLL